MYLVDLPDGTHVRWDAAVDYSIRRSDGTEIDHFTSGRAGTVHQARKVAIRHLRRNAERLGIVAPQP
jgi:hypothetical protein